MDATAVESEIPKLKELINLEEVEERTQERLAKLKQLPAIIAAFKYIDDRKLREMGYSYHFPLNQAEDHTNDMLHDAVLFAEANNTLIELSKTRSIPEDVVLEEFMDDKDFELLGILCAWHDTGFAELPREVNGKGHEEKGKINVRKAMNGLYVEEEIRRVESGLGDTLVHLDGDSMQVSSGDKISKFALDGDVSNFGREDFFRKSDLVVQETGAQDRRKADGFALNFLLKRHHWQTASAQLLRGQREQENIAVLETKLNVPQPELVGT